MAARMTGRMYFGRRLRIARERQVPKMSRRLLGEQVNKTGSAVAAWESGRNIPDPTTLAIVERILGTSGLLQDIVDYLVSGEKPQEYMAKWQHVEAQAAMLLGFSYDVVPGLLQIEEYARAILPDEHQVETRMKRQRILERENPPAVVTLIDESVLHHNAGGPTVMQKQLTHLVEMAQHENITIQVISMSSPICAKFTGPFTLASYNGESEVAYVDDALSGDIVETAEDVIRLRLMFERLRKHALSEQESIPLIKKAAESWQTKI
jgi:transcriptional regulator with XRE-family HTH domain